MGELAVAMKMLGNLPENVLIETGGLWSFAGRVDISLVYTQEDGSPLTEKQIKDIVQFGAGLTQGVNHRFFKDKEQAMQALRECYKEEQ